MRRKYRYQPDRSTLPEINLVPMMDVLMSVLTFFILVSMTLTEQQVLNLRLPQVRQNPARNSAKSPAPADRLTIALTATGELNLDGQLISAEQLQPQVLTFLQQKPQGSIVLKADQKLEYQRIIQVLKTLRDLGGDRVTLAIDTE